ncbi:MAG: beta-lactamase protein [Chthoniobacteraceae bacterium]|nr:beta-lactamase protein [Chthoniobacteraceae bacterium]
MAQQIPLTPEAIASIPHPDDGTTEIAADLAYCRLAMVNVVFFGQPQCGDRGWVLIDAGLPGMTGRIERAARERFGEGARPLAIVLTHGHFDHVGCLEKLSEKWEAPVFAHALERQFLDGSTEYPPPDTKAGGGIMPLLAPLFPRKPIDVSRQLCTLPDDGNVPGMPGWRWIHTPGHTPGHVSLWREQDRALIVGDAFITTAQESAYAVALQEPEMHGPPKYFTPDWVSARASVERLAALAPNLVVTGHGRAMKGAEMNGALQNLARDFNQVALPADATGLQMQKPT